MQASTTDFRNGFCMKFNHDLWQIVSFQHVKPGKGPAFVRTKLKSLTTGKVVDNTFPSGHKVEGVRIERRTYQFLYKDDMGYNFMNNKTYDQVNLQEHLIDAPQFLKEGQNVEIMYDADDEVALSCELPQIVTLKVAYTEPGKKGDTATNTLKPAELETGATINVPLFISTDEVININTKDSSYSGRT